MYYILGTTYLVLGTRLPASTSNYVSSFQRKVGPSYKIKKDAKKGVNGKADYSTNTSAIYMKYSSEEPLEKVLHGNVFVCRLSWNF